jgi:hypothetical protein
MFMHLRVVSAAFAALIVAQACSSSNEQLESAITQKPLATKPSNLESRKKDIVPGRYLIQLNPKHVGKKDPSTAADELLRASGGKKRKVFRKALLGFSAELSDAQVAALAKNPAVTAIEPVMKARLFGTQSPAGNWALDRIDQAALPLNNSFTYPNVATQVNIYVIDTGVRTTHQEFGGRAQFAFDTFVDENFPIPNTTDCHGHGTHVASLAAGATYGVAKTARIYGVRTLDCTGNGTTENIANSIDWVAQNAVAPAVANMSIGTAPSLLIDAATRNLVAQGVVVVVAAGNDTSDAVDSSPARVSTAITVGATTSIDTRAWFSNYGTGVDIFAPGESVLAAGISSDTATATFSGTSMASPIVAGSVALLRALRPSLTPEQISLLLQSNATKDVITNLYPVTFNGLLNIGFIGNAVTTAAPTVAISSPTNGSTIGGSVTITAAATDDVGVSRVGFFVDQAYVGDDTTAPFQVTINSALQTNGGHQVHAIALDANGNVTTSANIGLTISNSANISFDATLRAPMCPSTASYCDSGVLMNGAGSTETNAPNTYNSLCAVESNHAAVYHVTPSVDRVSVRTYDGGTFSEYDLVEYRVEWFPSDPFDRLEFWYNPYLTTPSSSWNQWDVDLPAQVGVVQTSTFYMRLIGGAGIHGFRAQVRNIMDVEYISSCDAMANDHDDLLVSVNPFVDTQAPFVRVDAPKPGETLTDTALVNAFVLDDVQASRVDYFIDGVLDSSWSYSPIVTNQQWWLPLFTRDLVNGPHTIYAVATDFSGRTATSPTVSFNTYNDTTPPVGSITSPTAGANLSGTVTLTANVTDNGAVAFVQFLAPGASSARISAPPYTQAWNTRNAANGTYNIQIYAEDTSGNFVYSTPISVTINNDLTPPTVSLVSPGAYVKGTIALNASASDAGGVVSVRFYAGTTLLGTDTTSPYSLSVNTTTLPNGPVTFYAKASDPSGNEGSSSSNSTVDNNLPTVAFTAPASGAGVRGNVTVSATASDTTTPITKVEFYDGATLFATDTSAPYSVTWATGKLPKGAHTLTAKAYDSAGNIGQATRSVTVQ